MITSQLTLKVIRLAFKKSRKKTSRKSTKSTPKKENNSTKNTDMEILLNDPISLIIQTIY